MVINKTVLRGTIVRITQTPKSVLVRLATDGGRNSGSRAANASDFPEIIFTDRKMIENFKVRDHATITGHMSTSITREGEKSRFNTLVFGDQIVKTKRVLAEYFDDIQEESGSFPNDINVVLSVGTVTNIYNPRNTVSLITVSMPDEEGHKRICEFSCFRRQKDYVINNIQKGDTVAIAGGIRTRRLADRTTQNVACIDITKIAGAEKPEEEAQKTTEKESEVPQMDN